jgi:hypothetical protein
VLHPKTKCKSAAAREQRTLYNSFPGESDMTGSELVSIYEFS